MNPTQLLVYFDRVSEAPDAITRLRRFILDLAVRGKLVEQDPNDESASKLLQRIDAEKAHLVEEGRIKKLQSFPKVELEEEPYEIPKNWKWTRLGEIGLTQTGTTPSKNIGDHFGNYIPFIKPGDIYPKRVDYENEGLSEAGLIESGRIAPSGSLLMVCIGTIGKCQVIDRDCSFNQQINSLSPYNTLCSRYLLVACSSEYFQRSAWTASARTTISILNKGNWELLLLPIPPLAEQHRIVTKVDELMSVCDRLEAAQAERESQRGRLVAGSHYQLNNSADAEAFRNHADFYLNHLPTLTTHPAHIQQLRQTILNLAVRGQLVTQDSNDEPASELLKRIRAWRKAAESEKKVRAPRKLLREVDESELPYQLPNGWSWARLGELIYIHSGDGLTTEAMRNGSIPVFGGNGITGFHDTPNIFQPSIVIGRVGYYCGSIHLTPAQAWVTDNAFVTEFPPDEIFPGFLMLLLRATNLKEDERATAQPVISGSKIYPIIVGLPPLAEQRRIVAKVDELLFPCDRLESQLTTAQAEKHSLLEAVLHQSLAETL